MGLTASDVREIAARIGVRPSKRLGQNFVIEQGTVRQIAALSDVTSATPGSSEYRTHPVLLEVGPGLGSLTLALLEAGAEHIIAVEIDKALAGELPRTLAAHAPDAAGRVTVLHADALRLKAADLPEPPTVLVANLPYNVAVPVLLHLLAELPSLRRGLIMVQAEVADRLCAAPGSRTYGAPSAKLAWYATARLAGTVPRTVFWPVPNVDSKLVAFTRHPPPLAEAPAQAEVPAGSVAAVIGPDDRRLATFAVVDAAFGQRRKTLRAALAGWAGSATEAERRLRAAGIDPAARGESLAIADFARIAAIA